MAGELSQLVDGLSAVCEVNEPTELQDDCNINSIINHAATEVNAQSSAGQVTVRFNNMLPVLRGNLKQLQALFVHLLQNALRFKRSGENSIVEVAAEEVVPGGFLTLPHQTIWHRITLKDNGTGFNPEQRNRIFEPFVRLNGKSAHPGAALGLAICKRITENHHGYISADAKPNAGCTIQILLPENLNL